MSYDIGDGIRVYGEFRDIGQSLIDPVIVRFKIKPPDGAVTTYVHGTDVELVKDSSGHYHVDVKALDDGIHYYRWETEQPDGAEEEGFKVIPSKF